MSKAGIIKVFKFGGASIATTENIKNVEQIIALHNDQPLVIVASAMGKTTNLLEIVVDGYFKNKELAKSTANEIKNAHINVCRELLEDPGTAIDTINNFFVEIEWLLEDDIETDYSYVYDQIVSIGELCSTSILAGYLQQKGHAVEWLDAREIIHTDDYYQEAQIDWQKTTDDINKKVRVIINKGKNVITQGFIGSTSDNNTTTLGREGSDFTGAILANALDAESLTIWKDVPGVLNADPRWLTDTIKLENMNYKEAVEQTYYGAKVIHPKTIKPLQNKKIPLHVRSFVNANEDGTTIQNQEENTFEKPIYILKKDQVLLHCYTRDFSFFDNVHINKVMQIFGKTHCDLNLLQNGAVQCSFVFDNDKDIITEIYKELEQDYTVQLDFGLELLTIRHYTDEAINQMMLGKQILMQQRTPNNFQALYKA